MRRKTRLILSILSGVAAVMIALLYASEVRAEASRAQKEAMERFGGDVAQVCVAQRDIDPGETIDEGNVRVEEWVASMLPAEANVSMRDVIGKTTTSRIPKGAVLSSVYFERENDAIEVPAGKVAVSVACDAEHAVGGALVRGETVDVYAARDTVADRLMSAQVVDTSSLADNGGALTWVTLAVKAESVRELLAAASRAPITLVIPAVGSSGNERGDD